MRISQAARRWVALLFGLAIIPVALTTSPQPEAPTEVRLSFAQTYKASQLGPVLAAVSGLVMGLVWTNGAVYVDALESDSGARFILATLLGGALCQLPIGRLSDLIDRRWVLLILGLVACIAIAVWVVLPVSATSVYVLGFVIGGTAMPMYSVGIAHANDNAGGQFLVVSGTMLVANGLGATAGPLLYGGFNLLGYRDVYFVIVGVAYFIGVLWTLYRLLAHDSQPPDFDPSR